MLTEPAPTYPLIPSQDPDTVAALDEIQRKVLWLATRMIDHANRERPTVDGLKVGGHQSSSASMVTAMTALYFEHLNAADRVAVKPHASPVLHAIEYLLGNLDRSYLTRLRECGGLQSYPSRTKDPDRVDFSTGSVGLGVASTLFASMVRRYVDAHFGARPSSRFVSLVGDAELDEGNVWEAVFETATAGLANVMWVIDFNRQSLDRVVPGIRIQQWRQQFEASGWHVVEVKYGARLEATFSQPGGAALRGWLDEMPNEQYQSLFGLDGPALRARFYEGVSDEVATALESLLEGTSDAGLKELVTDLGGHSLEAMLAAYAQCDAVGDRPSVIFAYTVKGWGLPIAGDPRNHSALLTAEQIAQLRHDLGLTATTEWDRFAADSRAGIVCNRRRDALRRPQASPALGITVPTTTGADSRKPVSTQEVFGRVLVSLSRVPGVGEHLVTTAPDVATSTNLAGFINRVGVFAPEARRAWQGDPLLKWEESPTGQHLELGISEMNLFLLLGQLGLAWDISDQPLLPVGTVYDPFVCRGLDALIYASYSGARFVVAGTPSGVTLAPEGGAHQSTITPSIGLELPGITAIEPAYAAALDWLLCDAIGNVAAGEPDAPTAAPRDSGAFYFRLSTRPIDQSPFHEARDRIGEALLRRQVLAGAYRLRAADPRPGRPLVHLAGVGAVMPEVLAAADELAEEGIDANVVDLTSANRLYSAWQRTLRQGIRTATTPSLAGGLREAFPHRAPVVTVHDAASHALSWLGSALGVSCVPVGVDEFGQSGSVPDLYRLHDLDAGSITNAALAALAIG